MSVQYEKLETCYKYYQSVTDFVPRVGLILGSGLGGYAKNMKVEKEIPYGKDGCITTKGIPCRTWCFQPA